MFEISELIDLLNSTSRPRDDGRPRWDRWKVYGLLGRPRREGETWKVDVIQDEPGGKLYVTLRAFQRAFPDVWDSILDAQALQRAA